VVVAATTLAGCGGSVSGAPIPVTASPAGDAAESVLDTGGYPTTRASPPGTAGSVSHGRILEGQRMANYVVVPSDVDAGLVRAIPQNTSVLKAVDELPDSLSAEPSQHFVVGFSTARHSAGPRSALLINIVLRFTDPAMAFAAADDMAAQYARTLGGPPPGVVSIPGHANALAFGSAGGDSAGVHSVTAHGSYVLYQFARSDGLDNARSLVGRTLDLQEPSIDRFVPVDPSRFGDLPADPTGLLSRTLPLEPDTPSGGIRVYQAGAALHYEDNPARSAALFAAAGVTAISIGKATVFRAADAAGAQRVTDALSSEGRDGGYRPVRGVDGLSAARCFDGGRDGDVSPRRFYCVGAVGQYAFEVFSAQEHDAHQQLAAQYRILAGR
jgi:hypothetical protein